MDKLFISAARVIESSDALLITAGAGMGVDSGLPDFRGSEGFWNAYPPYKTLGLEFTALANPRWFKTDPEFAWGFYGHRLNLYRDTIPHEGFAILKRWSDSRPLGSFVFTSNVDGQFQKAGFAIEKVVEAHGSIHHLQCMGSCRNEIFAATDLTIDVDQQTMRAKGPLPKCPRCRILARPNILMFRDSDWDDSRSDAQSERFHDWQESLKRHLNERGAVRLAIIELGAGGAIATVRHTSERLARDFRSPLIRINPREHEIPDGGIGIPLGSAHSLKEIDQRMRPRL